MTEVKLTVGRILADTSIPHRVKRLLMEIRPPPEYVQMNGLYYGRMKSSELEIWANKVFDEGERSGMSLKNIASCIIISAKAAHHSDEHIIAILIKHDLHKSVTFYTRSSEIGLFNPDAITLPKLKTLVERLSGLEEMDILRASLDKELVRKAEPNLRQIVASTYGEPYVWLKSIQNIQALLTSLESMFEEKKKAISLQKKMSGT